MTPSRSRTHRDTISSISRPPPPHPTGPHPPCSSWVAAWASSAGRDYAGGRAGTGAGCLTARQELSRRGVGLASLDNSDTHGSHAGRGPAGTRLQDCASARQARPARQRLTRGIQQQLHRRRTVGPAEQQDTQGLLRYKTGGVARRRRWGNGAGVVTSYTVAAPVEESQEDWRRRPAVPVEDKSRRTSSASSRSHGPAAERPELGLGEPESMHSWTGTTCRGWPLACSDWSEERDARRSRLDQVEGCGDNWKPARTGRPSRCAIAGVLT